MKKKTVIIIVVVFVVLLVGMYIFFDSIFDSIFPKAKPIEQLEVSMVESINIYDNEEKEIVIGDVELQKLINYINSATPTRTMSVNDYPSARPYYVIEIKTAEQLFRYIIYEQNGTAYAELPYEGIYEIDKKVIGILE